MIRENFTLLLSVFFLFGFSLVILPGLPVEGRGLPDEPLVVPLGEANSQWGMENLTVGRPKGSLRFPSEDFPNTFNDLVATTRASTDVTRIIMGSGLVGKSPVTGRIVPGLAKSWEISEDGRNYTFHLRKGLKFSDGNSLTAKDVTFTYRELIFNPEIETEKRQLLRIGGQLPEIEKVDDLTVRFTLPEPYGPFLGQISTGIYPKHKFADLQPERFAEFWGKETAQSSPEAIVGAGPFQLESFVPGKKLILAANPYYYKTDPEGNQLPYLQEYEVFKVEDEDVNFFKFVTGESDLLRPQANEMPYLLSRAEEKGWKILAGNGPNSAPINSDFLTFNWGTPEQGLGKLFSRSKFRRAVSCLIDRGQIIEQVFNGFGQLQFGPFSVLSPYHNPAIADLLPISYEPEKGKSLLDELGLEQTEGQQIIRLPSGDPVEFTILVNRENEARLQMAKNISRQMRKVGIKVDVESLDFSTYSSRLIRGDYQAAITSVLSNPLEPASFREVFTTEGRLNLWRPGDKDEPTNWEERVDNLFEQGIRSHDFAERKGYFDEFQRIFAEQLPVLYLPGESFLYAADQSIMNVGGFSRIGSFHKFAEFVWIDSRA